MSEHKASVIFKNSLSNARQELDISMTRESDPEIKRLLTIALVNLQAAEMVADKAFKIMDIAFVESLRNGH